MENKGMEIEMSPTSKKAEAEGENSHYYNDIADDQATDAEQGTSAPEKTRQLATKPYAGMGKEELLQFSQTPGWRAARWTCLLIILAGWCAMLGMAIYLIISTPRCLPWWQSAVVYQIFPRSFQDSANDGNIIGGDGVGDIRGIIDRVDYLSDLGINAVLLSAIYKSGGMDNSEDVVDFNDIDEDLGTIEDFEELVQTLHNADIKLILDFIPNHSSVDHQFFKNSQKVLEGDTDVDDKFLDYYRWSDAPSPNNWASLYSGSAWNCDVVDGKCFMHQYSNYTPDFSLDQEDVKTHLTDVLETWFTRGVDGFSIRGVRYFYEDDQFPAANEPMNPDYTDNGSPLQQYDATLHHYTAEYAGKSHAFLREWRDDIFYKFSTAGTYRVMLTDSVSNTTYATTYYGTTDEPEADLPMNFNLLQMGSPMGLGGEVTGTQLKTLIMDWMDKIEEGNWPNFQLGNYGASRIASRLHPLFSNVANMLLLTLPGTPICYYGDEIGMVNLPTTALTLDTLQDLRGKNDPTVWDEKTRDFQRSPMQWNDSRNAGFSTSDDLYLPVHSEYATVNVEAQMNDENSVLSIFRRLVALRSENRALTSNNIKFIADSEEVIAYVRELDSDRSRFFVALNFGSENAEYDYFHMGDGVTLPLQGTVAVATDTNREKRRVELNKLHLAPGEGVVVLLDEIVTVGDGWWFKWYMPQAQED